MTDSQYLGTIHIWQNLKEHHYHLTTTESDLSNRHKLSSISIAEYASFSQEARVFKTNLLWFNIEFF